MVHGELARTGPVEVLAWGLRRRTRVRIEGGSMLPTLRDGDEVLVTPRGRGPRPGDLVYVRHPFCVDVRLLKRVERIEPDGSLRLVGDNPPQSTDSRTLGAIPARLVLGRVTSRLP